MRLLFCLGLTILFLVALFLNNLELVALLIVTLIFIRHQLLGAFKLASIVFAILHPAW